MMSMQDQYLIYAQECIDSAHHATSDDVRKQFLELAKLWSTAAQQMGDGMSVPITPDPKKAPHKAGPE